LSIKAHNSQYAVMRAYAGDAAASTTFTMILLLLLLL
jgi:hypothetical protein